MSKLPALEHMRNVLDYDPKTGLFTWRRRVSIRVQIGQVAGSRRKDGYIMIRFNGTSRYGHQIAWWFVHGVWPERALDHINHDPSDNRIANLRLADKSQNGQNMRGPKRDGKSGFLGVSRHGRNRTWVANIRVPGVGDKYLGSFGTPEEAHVAYLKAKVQFHPFQTIVSPWEAP